MGCSTMMQDPLLLANKITEYIVKNSETTYSVLEARALSKGIDLNTFEQAMTAVHRGKRVDRKSTTAGEIVYSAAVIKEKPSDIIDTGVPYPRPPLCAACNGENCAECFPFFDDARDTRTAIRARWAREKEERLAVFNKRSSSKPAWVR